MGTYYNIRIFEEGGLTRQETADIEELIDEKLTEMNLVFSNWEANSEVTTFNQSNEPVEISEHFGIVLQSAIDMAENSNGLFDPTIGSLIELWGFGTASRSDAERVPSESEVQEALARSGYKNLRLTDNVLERTAPVEINLSAIAKGYAIDVIFEKLQEQGYQSILVEIGGDLRAGTGRPDRNWNIAIERPVYNQETENSPPRQETSHIVRHTHSIVSLENIAMATSGNYRQYFRSDGEIFSHIIDPISGRPFPAPIVSVTVIGEKAKVADALATTLMMQTVEQGKNLLADYPGYEALWIEAEQIQSERDRPQEPAIHYQETLTEGFKDYILE